jgi:uncharacterized membrane protein
MRAQRDRGVRSTRDGVDAGQLLPLYAVIVLIAGGAMLLLVHLGVLAVHRAHARTAADAAALAGAAEGRSAADEVARANGGVLESFVAVGPDVEVRVRVGSTHATARARRDGACQSAAQPDPVHFGLCHPTSPG